MQLSSPVGPAPALSIPSDLQATLSQARADGASHAGRWLAAHPAGSLDGLLGELYEALPAPPRDAALQVELDRTIREHRSANIRTHEAGLWYGRFGQAGTSRPNLWADVLAEWQRGEIARLGPVAGAESAARGARLLTDAIEAANVVIWKSKSAAKEARPYVLDPRTEVPKGGWTEGDYESHPSGHAGTAAAAAAILGALVPTRRTELELLADRVAYSRVLGEMHFPHDVIAGVRVGVAAAAAVLQRATIAAAA
jgi:hypothetical protein